MHQDKNDVFQQNWSLILGDEKVSQRKEWVASIRIANIAAIFALSIKMLTSSQPPLVPRAPRGIVSGHGR